ncbi:uncharacterized protein [Rutidosis leptorrhynchoides]|uniref:uncharacterized protein n=1 Tax=Rutidosis leptorrhynchoides TaxID=125765 RepID=UPI003A996BD3
MAGDDDTSLSNTIQVSSLDFGDSLYLHACDTSTTALISIKLKVFSSSAQLVWEELKETYDKIDGSITFNLQKKLNSLSQNGSSVSDYYHKLNALWKQFDALVKLPSCTCHANKNFKSHNDLIKLMQFLMGLDDSYSTIRSNILLSEPLPSVKSAFATISREESHRGSSFSSTTSKTPNTALLVSKTFDNKNVIGRGPNPNTKCTKCGKLGHIVDRCYDIVRYPPGWVKRNNNTYNNMSGNKFVSNYSLFDTNTNDGVSSMPFSNEQISKLMSLINDKSVGTSAHSNMEGNFRNNNEFFNAHINKFFHPNSSKNFKSINLSWIIDSGATQHMTISTKNLFNVVNVTNLGLTVSHLNGTFAKVTAIGNLKLINKIFLYDILIIPEYCDFIHVRSQRIGRQFGALYMFDDKYVINANYLNSYVYISNTLWHYRLDHSADPVLKIITVDVGICDIYHWAKQSREPFPLSDHKSKELELGDLIHLDLWGPYKVTNSVSSQNFMLVILLKMTSLAKYVM